LKKSQLIYQYIREQGIVSKQDIVIGLGLSLPTITQNLQYLVERGLIDTSKKIANTGGRNAIAYTYMENARYAIGVYLNRHYINCIALDLSGNVICLKRTRENFDLNDDKYLKKIGETVEAVKEETGLPDDKFLGVGIAVQGLISDDGEKVTYGLTLNFTGATREQIAKYIPYHNRLFHDSAAAGYAEVWIRDDLDDAFYLSLSNSVGGAVIIDNKIFEGDRRKAGEIGHMTVIPKAGDKCYCGQRGCFDTVCRAYGLAEYTKGNLEKFFELLESRDLGARRHWNRYMEYLAIGIHNIRMLYDTKIVIGGYVGAHIEKYMDDLCARVDARDGFKEKAETYLIPCKYKVEPTGAGAAIHLIDDFFETI